MKNEEPQYLIGVCVALVYAVASGIALWIWGFNDAHLRWVSRGIYFLFGYYVAGRQKLGGVIGGFLAALFDAVFGRIYSNYKELTLALVASFILQGVFFGFLGGLARMIRGHYKKKPADA